MGRIELDNHASKVVDAAAETSGLTPDEVVTVAVKGTAARTKSDGEGGGAADAEVAGDGTAADLD